MKAPLRVKKNFPGFKKGDVFMWRRDQKLYMPQGSGDNNIKLDIDEIKDEWFEEISLKKAVINIDVDGKTEKIEFETYLILGDIITEIEMHVSCRSI